MCLPQRCCRPELEMREPAAAQFLQAQPWRQPAESHRPD
jgi:hypothetical protein